MSLTIRNLWCPLSGLCLTSSIVSILHAAPGSTPRAALPVQPEVMAAARLVRERGLADDVAYETLRSLTTEVGPRLAGSDGDRRAVGWALARLRALGFLNVRAEPVKVPHWVRGEAHAEIVSPWSQPMVAVALGGSEPTPPLGLEAEVLPVASLDELKKMPRELVQGRIVFFHGRMVRALDVSGYSRAVAVRGNGAIEAAKLGAIGVVIRSVGTSGDRVAHTGGMRYDPTVMRVPALALSNPDADLLERQLASQQPVRIRMRNTSSWQDSTMSANVVGEMPGRGASREIVLLGAHLDSWDLSQGAHDDGAGCATMIAAAKLAAAALPRPARTIRVVLFANEEFGLSGAREYVRAHAAELSSHVMGMESDLGAFRVWGMSSWFTPEQRPLAYAMHSVLEPLGVAYLGNEATGHADVGQLKAKGVPVVDLSTDASPYFDLHHTANDTFDKVDPTLLRQNVAAYAVLAYLAAQAKWPGR